MRLTPATATDAAQVGDRVAVLNYGEPTDLTLIRRDRVWMIVGTLPSGSHLPAGYESTPAACLAYAARVHLEQAHDRAERRMGPLL